MLFFSSTGRRRETHPLQLAEALLNSGGAQLPGHIALQNRLQSLSWVRCSGVGGLLGAQQCRLPGLLAATLCVQRMVQHHWAMARKFGFKLSRIQFEDLRQSRQCRCLMQAPRWCFLPQAQRGPELEDGKGSEEIVMGELRVQDGEGPKGSGSGRCVTRPVSRLSRLNTSGS